MESSSSHMSIPSNCRIAIDELVRGRELADKLQNLLANKSDVDNGCIYTEDLVAQILNSFSTTLMLLNRTATEEVSQIPRKKLDGVAKSEDSGESCKSTSTVKDRRGSYKRRKPSESWSRVSSSLIDDGRAWRKYGQKEILNANFPRNYYRCTHKFDQGCQATKQVQRIRDEPVMFKTTYHGSHTCNADFLKAPQIYMESSPGEPSPGILTFGENLNTNITQNHPFFSSSNLMKHETAAAEDVVIRCELINGSEDVTTGFESSVVGSDQVDTATTHYSLDMDDMVGFDDVLHQFEF